MFCQYQEQLIQYDYYSGHDKVIVMCNKMNKECPYSKLKKAQKKCQYLVEVDDGDDT